MTFFLEIFAKFTNLHFFSKNLRHAEKRKHRKNPRNSPPGKKVQKSAQKFSGNLQICKIWTFPYEILLKFITFISRYRAKTAFLSKKFSVCKFRENLCKFCHFLQIFCEIHFFCKISEKKCPKFVQKSSKKQQFTKKWHHFPAEKQRKKHFFCKFFPREKKVRAEISEIPEICNFRPKFIQFL